MRAIPLFILAALLSGQTRTGSDYRDFRSDQYPLLLHDIPAVWWFTGFHPDYHQVTDTVDKINFEKMAKILKLAYLSGFEFADGRNTPRFELRAKARQ